MLPFDATARLVMPEPISVNNLYSNVKGRGRVTTKKYADWKGRAERMLSFQSPLPRFTGPVEITYFVGEKGVGGMDAGNVEKAATDALVSAGVIKDDSRKWLRSVQIIWTPGMRGTVAVIEPAGPSPLATHIAASVRQSGLLEI
jgi:Holliday junction resolvase RusA-like endonuclease